MHVIVLDRPDRATLVEVVVEEATALYYALREQEGTYASLWRKDATGWRRVRSGAGPDTPRAFRREAEERAIKAQDPYTGYEGR